MHTFFRRCPVCRTEIQGWTTKKLVQQTLDEESRREEVSVKSTQIRGEISLQEKKKEEEVPQDVQQKQDVTFNKHLESSTKNIYELCRFNSSDDFLKCLKCLHDGKAELSCLESLLILRSNLTFGRCSKHAITFIEKSNVSDIIPGMQLIESTLRYILEKERKVPASQQSPESTDVSLTMCCLYDVSKLVHNLSMVSARAFRQSSEEISKQRTGILKIIHEIESIHCHNFSSD